MQSSKLITRNDEFYLACTFLFEVQDVDNVTYLGIDRGIEEIAAWAVLDEDLTLKVQGHFEGSTLRDYQRKKEQRAKQLMQAN
mgnify:CR=1 FL=1